MDEPPPFSVLYPVFLFFTVPLPESDNAGDPEIQFSTTIVFVEPVDILNAVPVTFTRFPDTKLSLPWLIIIPWIPAVEANTRFATMEFLFPRIARNAAPVVDKLEHIFEAISLSSLALAGSSLQPAAPESTFPTTVKRCAFLVSMQ